MLKRAISGLIFLIIFITSLLWSPYSIAVLFFVVSVFASSELFRLVRTPEIEAQEVTGGILAKAFYLFPVAYLIGLLPKEWMSLVIIPFALIPILELFKNKNHSVVNMILSYFPAFYISIPFVFLMDIILKDGQFNPYPVLGFFILIWVYDTGAYLSGRFFGKHKLFERVSPKKTWEGLIGGGIICILVGFFVLSQFIDDLGAWEWGLLSLIVIVFGTFGDLIESMVKRNANVKDSGNIMPGHGGMLDRFDSAIFAAPFFWLLLQWI